MEVVRSIEVARPERETEGPCGPSSERMRSAMEVVRSIEEARPERETVTLRGAGETRARTLPKADEHERDRR